MGVFGGVDVEVGRAIWVMLVRGSYRHPSLRSLIFQMLLNLLDAYEISNVGHIGLTFPLLFCPRSYYVYTQCKTSLAIADQSELSLIPQAVPLWRYHSLDDGILLSHFFSVAFSASVEVAG